MPKLGTALMVAVIIAWIGVWMPPAFAKKAPVEVTGQTTCYNSSGVIIPCAGTGQDGDIQAGVPFPSPRFTDNGDGTVTDKLTKLIWLQDASCADLEPGGDGFVTWQQALDAANNLADDPASTTTDCGLSDGSFAGDWRLPNVKELQSLIDFGFFDPALSNAAGTAECTATDCAFAGVQSADYWSSTTRADNPGLAWLVGLYGGHTVDGGKDFDTLLVWPVRGGQ